MVDDEIEIAQLIREMLFDFEVTIAEHGERALEIWADVDFDVVVCDLMMPRISGVEVYQQVKNVGDGREKRMLFITGGAFTPATIDFSRRPRHPMAPKAVQPHRIASCSHGPVGRTPCLSQRSMKPTHDPSVIRQSHHPP